MSRGAAALERVLVFIVGLVLLALGAAAVAWWAGWIPGAPDRLDAQGVLGWTEEGWWPWALGAAGLVLIVLALVWLGGHTRRRTTDRLKLDGSGSGGRLTADAGALVDAAATAFDDVPGVDGRGGRVIRERGELVVELRARLDSGADLDEAADAAHRAAATLRARLGPDVDARCRVLFTGAGSRSMSRVR